jgi:NADH-quinone oxidoreductase subunit N
VSEHGDGIRSLENLGAASPLLAVPMTVAMLSLAGFPATVGFIGKFYLIEATVDGNYAWLGVVIVVGSMISLGYYLPVIAAMWMREAPAAGTSGPEPGLEPLPALAGGSSELDTGGAPDSASPPDPSAHRSLEPEVALVALLAGAATIFFGVIPQPLFDLVHGVGAALGLL